MRRAKSGGRQQRADADDVRIVMSAPHADEPKARCRGNTTDLRFSRTYQTRFVTGRGVASVSDRENTAMEKTQGKRAHVMSEGVVWRNNLRSLLRRLETPDFTQLDDDVTQMSTQQQPELALDAFCDSIKPQDVISHVTHELPFVSTKADLKHDRLYINYRRRQIV